MSMMPRCAHARQWLISLLHLSTIGSQACMHSALPASVYTHVEAASAPAEYVTEFQRCLDRTEPVPWPTIQQRIEAELGKPTSSVFSYVNPVPLASASVAQVHEAGAQPLV